MSNLSSINLDNEYRETRAALVEAGINMCDSMDALYRDWQRWRLKSGSRIALDARVAMNADEWWARHLAQFRSLIDPTRVAARADRVRKDGVAAARPRTNERKAAHG